ncbi:hypothetical protein CC1G_13232 [Coprinopsis cinerea okayama7|uniref:Uncharacterized protein n=1 Tax=Coprinopsis cinerea (strain Okayama-7 / 130 / ATCC MYA-4618 / FGSC 9003) TaxID=240176 RepID=A8PI28_COPC7|nr:hypothetical protein CC1G_13232 [Coprinopsis cinerea okayama7\|eukprot:XP_001841505.2 hypothetical protein CC1G_13232 [Coprinopsis cinerea okayama7\
MAELSVKVDEETASETVWKAQGKTRPGIDDSIAVGTAQVLKALESNLILKTSDHLHKVLAVLFSPVEGISKSDPKNHNAIFASLDTAKRFVWSIWPRATAPSLLTHEPPHNFGMLSEEDQKRIIDYSPNIMFRKTWPCLMYDVVPSSPVGK